MSRFSRGSSSDRPDSALARGVHITEQRELRVNPEPLVTEEADILLEEYLSPRKLVSVQWFYRCSTFSRYSY